MPSPIVAILEPGYADYAVERELLAPFGAQVVPVAEASDAVATLRGLDPVALMVREHDVSRAVIATCPNLKAIVRYGIGVDNVDLDAATEHGVRVANVPDYGAEHEVSDHAVALYLALVRRIVSRDAAVRRGAWGIGQSEPIPGHRSGVLGLIGYGRIARVAAVKFKALGFSRVLAHDPHVGADALAANGIEPADVDTICAQADTISLHVPLLPDTRHILDRRRIGLMKRSAVVINVSRGGLLDEEALAEAVNDGRLFGAGIDVFDHEPPLPDNPLLACRGVVLSDHIAWYSEASVLMLQQKAAKEVARVLAGQDPQNWVNKWPTHAVAP